MRFSSVLFSAILALFLLTFVAFASDSDDVTVTVTVEKVIAVEYTGPDPVSFTITGDDLDHGSKALINQGDLNWWANAAPWTIYVKRTHWDLEDYGANGGVDLEVKYGPPDYDDGQFWQLVDCETHHGSSDHEGDPWVEPYGFKWVASPDGDDDGIGSGTFQGVDWKVKHLDWTVPPGTYSTMVTFTGVID